MCVPIALATAGSPNSTQSLSIKPQHGASCLAARFPPGCSPTPAVLYTPASPPPIKQTLTHIVDRRRTLGEMKRAASARSAKKSTRVTTKVVKTLRPGPTKFVGLPRRNPSAVSSRTRSRTGPLGLGAGPTRYTNRRMQIIEEDEYIGEILGTGGFYTTPYSCNPGQSQTFPWGSRIFSLYEEYEFTSLEFYYKREVSEFATNGQTGKVMLSFDYDASDPAPTTKLQVEDSRTHVDFMPCTPQDRKSVV